MTDHIKIRSITVRPSVPMWSHQSGAWFYRDQNYGQDKDGGLLAVHHYSIDCGIYAEYVEGQLAKYKELEAELAEAKKDRDHYRQKCDLLSKAGFESEECVEKAEAKLAEAVKREGAQFQRYMAVLDRLKKAEAELKALTAQAPAKLGFHDVAEFYKDEITAQEPDAWLTRSSRGGAIYSTAHDQQQDAYDDAHAERIAGVDAVEVLPLYLDLRGKEGFKNNDKVIDCMVDRFLNWRLPHDFAPDCGITFDGCKPDALGYAPSWPVGTNLFTADQARAMLEYVIHGEEKK